MVLLEQVCVHSTSVLAIVTSIPCTWARLHRPDNHNICMQTFTFFLLVERKNNSQQMHAKRLPDAARLEQAHETMQTEGNACTGSHQPDDGGRALITGDGQAG